MVAIPELQAILLKITKLKNVFSRFLLIITFKYIMVILNHQQILGHIYYGIIS